MNGKDPTMLPWLTYGWVFALSTWGGVVHHMRKCKGQPRVNLSELIGDVVTAGFSGMMTFYLVQASGIDMMYGSFLVGMSGLMGNRMLLMLEQLLARWARHSFKLDEGQ